MQRPMPPRRAERWRRAESAEARLRQAMADAEAIASRGAERVTSQAALVAQQSEELLGLRSRLGELEAAHREARAQAAEAGAARAEAERLLGEARRTALDAEERFRSCGSSAAADASAASRAEGELRREREEMERRHAGELSSLMSHAQAEQALLQQQCEAMMARASEAVRQSEDEAKALRQAAAQAATEAAGREEALRVAEAALTSTRAALATAEGNRQTLLARLEHAEANATTLREQSATAATVAAVASGGYGGEGEVGVSDLLTLRGEALQKLAEERWRRLGATLQAKALAVDGKAAEARAAAAEMRESTTRALAARSRHLAGNSSHAALRPASAAANASSWSSAASGAAAMRGTKPMGQNEALSEWVPVIDVFTSARLSESEEALMRRVIASRMAPAPTISYTRRPL